MRTLLTLIVGAVLALSAGVASGSIANPFPYAVDQLNKRTLCYYSPSVLTAGSSALTESLPVTSKGIKITNEGSYYARVTVGGPTISSNTAPTATVGDLIAPGDSEYFTVCTNSIKYIRAGANDTTLTYRADFDNN